MDFSIRGYEYPVGAFNFFDSECHGGCFIDEPVVEMDYEFDFDYYDEAYAEYERAECFLEYNRERIKRMSPRDFEFFVAEIFEKLGFSVRITQATRDGGKDIIATKADPIPYKRSKFTPIIMHTQINITFLIFFFFKFSFLSIST